MLPDEDLGRLRDAVTFGACVVAMVDGINEAAFIDDTKTIFAVRYGLQVVGEAVWKLNADLKQQYAEIPWPLIASMRHRLVHDYGKIDETIVYHVVTDHLPPLLDQLQAILAEYETQ